MSPTLLDRKYVRGPHDTSGASAKRKKKLTRRQLAQSICNLPSNSLSRLIDLLEQKAPSVLISPAEEQWYFDVGTLPDAAFRVVEAFVGKELNDDDYLGRSRHEREAAESIAAIVTSQSVTTTEPHPDDDDDGGLVKKKKERKGAQLILRDKDKDKNFEFNGVPCLLLSQRTDTSKPWVCLFPECDKAFSSKDKQIRHALIHTGDKPFKCPMCGRGFNDTANLNNHLRTQHFYCHSCQLQFESRRAVDTHFSNHAHSHARQKIKQARLSSADASGAAADASGAAADASGAAADASGAAGDDKAD